MFTKEKIKEYKLVDMLICLVIVSSIALRKLKLLLYLIQAVFIVVGCKELLNKTYKSFWLFRILYFFWMLLSIYWSRDVSSVLSVIPSIIQILVLTLIMCGYIDDNYKIDRMIDMFVLAGFSLLISILIFTPLSEWKDIIFYSSNKYVNVAGSVGRLGPSVGMHSNGLGQTLVVCIMCIFYRFIKTKKKLLLLLMILLLILTFLGKSRSSLIEVFCGIFLIYTFSKKNTAKQIFYFVLGGCLLVVGLYLLINIPFFYKIIGYRLEGLALFGNSQGADASTVTRLYFVKIGWKLFFDNPIFGVGMNNFSYIAFNEFSTWAKVYSHNNYIEILSNLGIIGFFLYYYLYFKSFMILTNLINKTKNSNKLSDIYEKAAFLLAMLLVFAIMNVSHITYETECVQYMGMIIIIGSILLNKKYNEMYKINGKEEQRGI